jgi:hypothetical protein
MRIASVQRICERRLIAVMMLRFRMVCQLYPVASGIMGPGSRKLFREKDDWRSIQL